MAKQSGSTKQKRDKDFLRKPKFEGGAKAIRAFVAEHLRYPTEALTKRIQGDVHVKYDVDENGNVVAAKVARAIGGGCDEEALRVVRLMKYIAARNRGTHVTSHHDIVIHFRLPLEHVQPIVHNVLPSFPQQVQMNYSYVPAPTNVNQEGQTEETKSPVVFTWTVQRNNS